MKYIVEKKCTYCKGTGDWRGKKGLGDDKSLYWLCNGDFSCLHCKGTGIEKQEFENICKYCGEPCAGYCCKNCYDEFEGDYCGYEEVY